MDLLQKPQWDPITPTLLGGFTPIIPFLGLNINENSSIIGYIFHHSPYPIGSMYGIYANIGCILMVNVTIYTIHGSYGYEKTCWSILISQMIMIVGSIPMVSFLMEQELNSRRQRLPNSWMRWLCWTAKPSPEDRGHDFALLVLQGGAPQVISWFIIPLTIDISPINIYKHFFWSYLHQLSYRTGAPPCKRRVAGGCWDDW